MAALSAVRIVAQDRLGIAGTSDAKHRGEPARAGLSKGRTNGQESRGITDADRRRTSARQ